MISNRNFWFWSPVLGRYSRPGISNRFSTVAELPLDTSTTYMRARACVCSCVRVCVGYVEQKLIKAHSINRMRACVRGLVQI